MMKKIIIALVLTISISSAIAQEKGTQTIGFKIGVAAPSGDFADYEGGNAESGVSLEISSSYFIQENLSILIIGRSQINSVDAQAMANDLSLSTGANSEVSSNNWSTGQLLLGVQGLLPIGDANIVFVSGRLAGGLITASSPEVEGKVYNNQNSMNFKIEESSGVGFGYLIGTGFTFNISSLINLNIAVDYTGGNVDFGNVRTTTTQSDGTQSLSVSNEDQSFATTNINLGIDFKF